MEPWEVVFGFLNRIHAWALSILSRREDKTKKEKEAQRVSKVGSLSKKKSSRGSAIAGLRGHLRRLPRDEHRVGWEHHWISREDWFRVPLICFFLFFCFFIEFSHGNCSIFLRLGAFFEPLGPVKRTPRPLWPQNWSRGRTQNVDIPGRKSTRFSSVTWFFFLVFLFLSAKSLVFMIRSSHIKIGKKSPHIGTFR